MGGQERMVGEERRGEEVGGSVFRANLVIPGAELIQSG